MRPCLNQAGSELLTKLARVPKAEIDADEKREQRNKDRRKTPKPAARPRQIVPTDTAQ